MKTKIFGLEIDTDKITLQQKIIAGGVAGVLVLGLLGWYVGRPVVQEYMALSQEISQLKTERDAKRGQVKRIDQLKKESDQLNEQIELLTKAIPKKENIPILLIDIEKLSNRTNTTLTSFKPGPARPYAGLPAPAAKEGQTTTQARSSLEARLREIPLQLTAKTNYRDLIKLFDSLENYERVVKVTSVSVVPSAKSTAAKKASFDGMLDISFEVTSYVLEQ